MVMTSAQVQQQLYMQQIYMQQQQQAFSLPQGPLPPGFPGATGPMMPRLNPLTAMQHAAGGVYGEQLAMGAWNGARTVGNLAAFAGGVGLSAVGMDPFGLALTAGRAGYGMAGIGGAIGGAALPLLGGYALSKGVGAYTGAFTGGMHDQVAINSVLRSSFNFHGGQGAFGRGFSQGQMGQIGSMISQEARSNPFTSATELNQLVSQGAESGMFTAVRDVKQFAERFRTMLNGLKEIQKELGGSLSDALSFTRGAQQLGIFSNKGRQAFASEMRDTMAVTGMSQDQAFALSAQGSMLSRATGGFGRQGAVGALRTARTLGAAISSGAINPELLSEATGGLQGQEAIQAFTGRILQQSERFSRRAMGRFSIFAMSNADATGLDQGMVDRFLSGDISTGEVSQAAHANVNKMGRARAINREGYLRGALLEQGGLAGQIGMIRKVLGDRVLDQSDDLGQLVLQRRFGMGREESQMMMSMIRNQGRIAQTELLDRSDAKRQTAMTNDIRENRSLEAFMTHLEHGVKESMGLPAVREMGRKFMTKLSSITERAMNDFLGIQAQAMSEKDRSAMNRLFAGAATAEDVQRLTFSGTAGKGAKGLDPFSRSLAGDALHALGFHAPKTVAETMKAMGVDLSRMSERERVSAINRAEMAQQGIVFGGDMKDLDRLRAGGAETLRRISMAQFGAGGFEGIQGSVGASANAINAFLTQGGYATTDLTINRASMMGQGGGAVRRNLGGIGAQFLQGMLTGGAAGAGVGAFGAGIGAIPGAIVGGLMGGLGYAGLELARTVRDPGTDAAEFVARGGHLGKAARGGLSSYDSVSSRFTMTRRELAQGLTDSTGLSVNEARSYMKGIDRGVDPDAVRAFTESDTFKSAIARIDSYKGAKGAQMSQLAALEQEAMKLDPSTKEGAAARAVVAQVRHNLDKKGFVGGEFRDLTKDKERYKEFMDARRQAGFSYEAFSQGLKGTSIGNLAKGISDSLYNPMSDAQQLQGDISKLRNAIVDMDPNSKEYQEVVKAAGKDESIRAMLMGASVQRNYIKEITGEGRRGKAGAADSALALLTGGSLSNMDITTTGGRQLQKRNQAQVIMQALSRGGKDAEHYAEQLQAKLLESGVTDADKIVKDFVQMGKGGFTKDEARSLTDKLMKNEDLQNLQKKQVEEMQKKQNPLDFDRNKLLEQIRDKLPEKDDAKGPSGATPA